ETRAAGLGMADGEKKCNEASAVLQKDLLQTTSGAPAKLAGAPLGLRYAKNDRRVSAACHFWVFQFYRFSVEERLRRGRAPGFDGSPAFVAGRRVFARAAGAAAADFVGSAEPSAGRPRFAGSFAAAGLVVARVSGARGPGGCGAARVVDRVFVRAAGCSGIPAA